MNEIQEEQHKRTVMLAAAALVFAGFAVREVILSMFSGTVFIGLDRAASQIYLLLSCVLMSATAAYIMVQSFVANATLRHLAMFDNFTGLPNRENMLSEVSLRYHKNDSYGIFMFVDIDRLKSINNSMGRSAGDHIIQIFSKRLQSTFVKPILVARFSADRFVILVPDLDNFTSVFELSDKVSELAKAPVTIDGKSVFINVSMGATIHPVCPNSVEEAFRQSEIALIEAKNMGGNRMIQYNKAMDQSFREKGVLETELREVLERGALEPYFQPLIDADSGMIVGVEALARWNHPDQGYIPPASFIPVAETLGLVEKLGQQILRKSCSYIKPLGDLIVSVNISPKHLLKDTFEKDVIAALEETGLPAHRLEIEITESVFLENIDLAISKIKALRQRGILVALDDFGTGYSGLSYLNQFEVDRVKIDASFMKEIETSSASKSMVATIIQLCKDRNFSVTIEGVETVAQIEFLDRFDGLRYQGYYFSKPLDLANLLSCELMARYNEENFHRDEIQPQINPITSAAGARSSAV